MNILAFDTAFQACSVALQKDKEIFISHAIAPMQQASLLLPAIEHLLVSASLSVNDLDMIANGGGPGSFTGCRIAASAVQGFGFGLHKPIVTVSSLAAIAQTVFSHHQKDYLLTAMQAHGHQLYWAIYAQQKGEAVLVGEEHLSLPEEITLNRQSISPAVWGGAGDGWTIYPEKLKAKLGFLPVDLIPLEKLSYATGLLTLAQAKFQRGEYQTTQDALIHYLR